MNTDIRFQLGYFTFVGNPAHAKTAHTVLVQADKKYHQQDLGLYYLPEVMRIDGFGQSVLYFGLVTPKGVIQVKVFGNN